MASLLNSSLVNPLDASVSVKSIGITMGLTFPLSVKTLLQKRDMSKVKRYGVCVCTFPPTIRGTNMNAGWFDKVFFDGLGVASYFRKMSGGRQFIEWQVFGPVGLMTQSEIDELRKKWELKNHSKITEGFRLKAKAIGIPVDRFDRWLWIIDMNNNPQSQNGTTPDDPGNTGDSLIGASYTFDPEVCCHEMLHSFGLPHASSPSDDYGDTFCVMGAGRQFENPRISVPLGDRTAGSPPIDTGAHSNTGPGICSPYLHQLGWLDYETNVNHIGFGWFGIPIGNLTGSLYANQGGPPHGSGRRIALTIPTNASGDAESNYWIEYRIAQGFDSGIGFDLPPEGVLVLREVKSSHSYIISWLPVAKDKKLRLPNLGYEIKITDIEVHSQQLFYSLEKI